MLEGHGEGRREEGWFRRAGMGAPMAANIAQAESSLTDYNRKPYVAAARTSAAEGAYRQRPKALKTHHSPAI